MISVDWSSWICSSATLRRASLTACSAASTVEIAAADEIGFFGIETQQVAAGTARGLVRLIHRAAGFFLEALGQEALLHDLVLLAEKVGVEGAALLGGGNEAREVVALRHGVLVLQVDLVGEVLA